MQYQLFLIIPPGLEDLALEELESKCPVSPVTKVKGGLELIADMDWIVKAHCLLKIPTRILMRIKEFKVRDFPKLHQKFVSLKWNEVLSHPEPHWEISCSKSRLMHTGRIEETIQEALKEALVRQPLSRDWEKKNFPPQTFYVRLVDDNLTLSLDLTGDPLYKRGYQKIKGEAPLRENFAAAFLLELFKDLKEEVTLVDPMCGSGTFLTEALNFHMPGHHRPFAFETAPFFKGKLVRLPLITNKLPVKDVIGFDLNEILLKKVKEETGVDLRVQDSVATPIKLESDFVMICNPPYGERIKIAGKRGSFLKEAWLKFLKEDKPLRFAWVLPSDMDDLFQAASGYKLLNKRHLKNGGLAVTFWVWERL
ncbi:MAG: class I SAM-dependent RNA methyltransferase [Bacteriovoracia bacterium]